LRVLFILPEFFPITGGGICTYYNQLIPMLKNETGWEIIVIQGSAFDSKGGEKEWAEIPIHYLPPDEYAIQKRKFPQLGIFPELQNHVASAWAMYNKAQSLNLTFDLVITTDWGLNFIPWIIKNSIPVIVHLHGSIGQIDHYEPKKGLEILAALYLNLEINLFSYANSLVTHSDKNINFWHSRILRKNNFHLIPPTILDPIDVKEPVVEAITVIGLVVGRIQYWKGPIHLCQAVQQLSENDKNKLKIYWIGRDTFYHDANSNMTTYLSKTFPEIWGKTIIPIGEKTHSEIETLYPSVDFGIVPSTWDMFNLSAVEHLFHKKPLICSSNIGASDFFGLAPDIILYNKLEELTNGLKVLINTDKTKLVAMGKRNYQFARNEFDNATTLKKHIETIKSTVSDFKPELNLATKFSWLIPQENEIKLNSKEVLLESWPLKEIMSILLKRIKSRVFKK
jgi:glycosyltransferase involved in cell wall biosynthesis